MKYFISRLLPIMLTLALALSCSKSAKESGNVRGQNIVGAWKSSIQFSSGAFAPIKDLEFLYVFNLGGTMTESSNYDAAPPVPPAYGIWRHVADLQYEAKYEFYMTRVPDSSQGSTGGTGWVPAGIGILNEVITLDPGGNSFTSKIRYEAYDQSGKLIEGAGGAIGHGKRMTF